MAGTSHSDLDQPKWYFNDIWVMKKKLDVTALFSMWFVHDIILHTLWKDK